MTSRSRSGSARRAARTFSLRSAVEALSNGETARLVLDEVAERGALVVAHRLLQRDGLLGDALDVAHLAHGPVELAGDLLRRRLAAEVLDEGALDVGDLVEALDHVDGDADGPALVGDRAGDGLADPPGGVGRELVAAAVVELLHRADQAERPLLDEVEEGQPAARGSPWRSRRRARRLASTIACLASRSPRSMRRASSTSRSPVSSSTRPIARRYRRSESSDGSTVRSMLAGGREDRDALLGQIVVELGDLLLGDVDVGERGRRSARPSAILAPALRRSAVGGPGVPQPDHRHRARSAWSANERTQAPISYDRACRFVRSALQAVEVAGPRADRDGDRA